MPSAAFAIEGFYLGGGAVYQTNTGDFKEESLIPVSATEAAAIPKVEDGVGYGIVFGYGFHPDWAAQMNYEVSVSDGQFGTETTDVTRYSVDFLIKYRLAAGRKIEPYFLLGGNFAKLVIEEGAFNLSTSQSENAEFTGYGASAGLGFDFHISSRISIGTDVLYRYVEYDEYKGVLVDGLLDEKLDGSSVRVMAAVLLHF
jgi:opacity protein-like surface antigen